jgi:probable rRNA maturation factor|tara:strand:+ start:201 stop:671 length:471 start_codon:yes stop_codon:yes gene_type:complete
MINVDVVSESSLWDRKIRKKDIFFKSLVSFFPKKYRFIKKKVSLTILLSSNRNIKKLNKKFRNKNKSTDILSFPFKENFNIKKSCYIGDIIVSYEFLNKPKNLNSLEFKKKVIKIFIHGFLHLLGYDHIKLKDFKKMTAEENKIYEAVKIKMVKLV